MNAISKSFCIDILDNMANKHNNTNRTTIKMEPIGVTLNTSIDFKVENNEEDPQFKVADNVTIYTAGKYWSPGRPEDVPLQRPQDVP